MVAVESLGTPTLARALEAGHPVDVEVGGLAADALGATRIGALGLALAQAHLSGLALVPDEAIRATQVRLWDEMHLLAEPGGAAALAALVAGAYRPRPGERVGAILCGSNADVTALAV